MVQSKGQRCCARYPQLPPRKGKTRLLGSDVCKNLHYGRKMVCCTGYGRWLYSSRNSTSFLAAGCAHAKRPLGRLAVASDYSVEQAVVQPRSSGLSWGSEPPAFHQALDETEAFDATVRRRIEIRIR